MAYQVADVVTAMEADAGMALDVLRVDGGARRATTVSASSRPTCSACPVERPVHAETTAIGAAALAGLAVGVWDATRRRSPRRAAVDRRFEPAMDPDRRERLVHGWHRAVERSRSWVEPGPDRRRVVRAVRGGSRPLTSRPERSRPHPTTLEWVRFAPYTGPDRGPTLRRSNVTAGP